MVAGNAARGHEAVRDLVRAREAAQEAEKRSRQQLLRYGRMVGARLAPAGYPVVVATAILDRLLVRLRRRPPCGSMAG
ncbi:MAG: hypothetical protein E5X54_21590 [Mesorhizobium sp.]|nr:MAG: hypothetical protein EOR53_18650 [Mesorhizobium sp.]TIQ27478.1 MAG: hypothetical protein E5X54_21590 [Mesorhizobium sp.]